MRNEVVEFLSAFGETALYCISIGFVFLLPIHVTDDEKALDKLAWFQKRKVIVQAWSVLAKILLGLTLIPLVTTINHSFASNNRIIKRSISVLGFLWLAIFLSKGMISELDEHSINQIISKHPSYATAVRTTISCIQNLLDDFVALTGGVWIISVALTNMRLRLSPIGLSAFGVLVGSFGFISGLFSLSTVFLLFGTGQIIWFGLMGICHIKAKPKELKTLL